MNVSASRPVQQRSFVFEVTGRCNHACPHCYNVWKAVDYPCEELNTADTLRILDAMLRQSGASLVTLTGGEPLLRPDLYEIVDFLAERGIGINLISNGSLLTESAIARLGPKRISFFELPLLGCCADTHDELSGRRGAFDDVTRAVADLKLAEARVVSVFVATRRNLSEFRETAELAIALGADGLMLNRFNPGGEGIRHIDELQATPAEMQRALDAAEEISREYEFPISCSIAMPPCLFDTQKYERLTFGFCAAGTDRAYYTLDPQGNIRPCNHSPTILGNLRRQSLEEIVNGSAMTAFMAACPEFCAGCRLERECLGGCKAAAEVCYGSPAKADPFLSAFMEQARKL